MPNRGNYRRDLFLKSGEAKAFLTTLKEAKKRMGRRCALAENQAQLAVNPGIEREEPRGLRELAPWWFAAQTSASVSSIRLANSGGVNTSSLERFAMHVSTSGLRPRRVELAGVLMAGIGSRGGTETRRAAPVEARLPC